MLKVEWCMRGTYRVYVAIYGNCVSWLMEAFDLVLIIESRGHNYAPVVKLRVFTEWKFSILA